MSIQQLLNGVSLGSVYALIAVGFALVFNILKFSNFAHGGVMTLTAYIGLAASLFFQQMAQRIVLFTATLLSAALAGALIGIVLERMAFRRIRNNQQPGHLLLHIVDHDGHSDGKYRDYFCQQYILFLSKVF